MIGELYRDLSPVCVEKLCFRRNLQLAMELDSQPPAVAAVLQTVMIHGPLTRTEIGQRTGLSSGAVTKAAIPLIDDGWITELGKTARERSAGRPATPIAVCGDRAHFLGVKVTADELIGVRIDLAGKPVAARRAELNTRDVDSVVQAISRLAKRLIASPKAAPGAEIHGLGVTISGDVDRKTGAVHYSPFLNWRGVPLAQLAEKATGIPVVIENDVRALTVAEQLFGAGAGITSFALVTVGTGVGCGLWVNGQVISGAHGVAGEIGHLPVSGADRMCTCGNTGCVEAVAATQPILDQARQATGNPRLSMKEAIRLAHNGNSAVRDIFIRAAHALGLALASVANLIGPERIILSGEGVVSYELFADRIRDTFAAQAFGAAADCEIIMRPLPFEEWARGGAAVAAMRLVAPRG
jgi:predicted NBD/HSP70 family sugar kinase